MTKKAIKAEDVKPGTESITIRLKHSTVNHFKAPGKGYQTRIKQVLENHVRAQNPLDF